MTIQMQDGRSVQWIGVNTGEKTTHDGLKFAADIDYVAFITLWDSGLLHGSTYVWTAAHCIEKYCKALILKNNPTIEVRDYSQKLDELWNDAKNHLSQINQQPDLDSFISELQDVRTPVRYGNASIAISSGLLAIVSVLGAVLRYDYLGEAEYQKTPYGLMKDLFFPRIGSSFPSTAERVQRIMHFVLHHNFTFSSMAIPDTFSFMGMDLVTSHLVPEENIENGCPWCQGYTGTGQMATLKLREFIEYNV
jgi:hypothetical protein